MASYKVAQDVEADDKLLGPFTFRQFIYLIIVAIAIALAWFLGRLLLPLAILPLPVILFFGALALPLRKDQPMEVYLAALLSFYLKPRKRLWDADGVDSLIEITAPKEVEVQRVKDLSQSEAERRLSYLADIADTQGWAVRRVAEPMTSNSMINDTFFEAQQTQDILDDTGSVSQSIDTMINEADQRRREDAILSMQQAARQPAAPPISYTTPAPQPTYQAPVAAPDSTYATPAMAPGPAPAIADQPVATPTFNPYPTIRQSVIQPLGADDQVTQTPPATTPPANPAPSTSATTVSPDIINLASNTDLSIETIQREAQRITEKAERDASEDEVFVSLR